MGSLAPNPQYSGNWDSGFKSQLSCLAVQLEQITSCLCGFLLCKIGFVRIKGFNVPQVPSPGYTKVLNECLSFFPSLPCRPAAHPPWVSQFACNFQRQLHTVGTQ